MFSGARNDQTTRLQALQGVRLPDAKEGEKRKHDDDYRHARGCEVGRADPKEMEYEKRLWKRLKALSLRKRGEVF